MDLVRPRAIPALAAALGLPAAAAGADCTAIDGTYRFESTARAHAESETLGALTRGPEQAKLYRVDRPETRNMRDLAGNGLIRRGRTTALAARATVVYAPGATRFRYLDASGRLLAESRLDASPPWQCRGTRLARSFEHLAGLGDAIRTERVEEALERDGAGNLVHRQSITVVEGPGRSRVVEARFAPAPAEPAR